MFIGLLFTLLLPETKGKTLEEIVEHNENEARKRKIKKNSQSFQTKSQFALQIKNFL